MCLTLTHRPIQPIATATTTLSFFIYSFRFSICLVCLLFLLSSVTFRLPFFSLFILCTHVVVFAIFAVSQLFFSHVLDNRTFQVVVLCRHCLIACTYVTLCYFFSLSFLRMLHSVSMNTDSLPFLCKTVFFLSFSCCVNFHAIHLHRASLNFIGFN